MIEEQRPSWTPACRVTVGGRVAHATPPVATSMSATPAATPTPCRPSSAVLSVFELEPGQQCVTDHLAEGPGAGEEAERRFERRVEAERE